MDNKVLITGGTGLVGSSISQGIKLSSKDGDLRDLDKTLEIFDKHKPNKVIHCAGRVGGLGGNMNYKGDFFYAYIMMNTNVIEAARRTGVERLVCFLSTCVFPDDVEYPLTEEKVKSLDSILSLINVESISIDILSNLIDISISETKGVACILLLEIKFIRFSSASVRIISSSLSKVINLPSFGNAIAIDKALNPVNVPISKQFLTLFILIIN